MSLGNPSVTVALITYNHEKYISEAIESILGQSLGDLEVIVVDDGSTDGTAEIIGKFQDERIIYVRQENEGPSAARNTALRMARSSLVAQMSGDDVAEPDRIERQLEILRGRKDCVVFSDVSVIDDDGHPLVGRDLFVRRMANRSRLEVLRYLFRDANCFAAPTALAAREVFESIGGYDPVLLQIQDWDMWTRLLLNGIVPLTVPAPLLRYRIRARQGNLSAPTVQTGSRVFFETKRMLRAYCRIQSVAELRGILPEVSDLGYPLEDRFTSFYLAILAIQNRGRNRATQYFGGDLLLDLMADPDFRALLGERLGFRLPDLFRTLGAMDPWNRAELEAMRRSKSWRFTRPLRALYAFRNRLMPGKQ